MSARRFAGGSNTLLHSLLHSQRDTAQPDGWAFLMGIGVSERFTKKLYPVVLRKAPLASGDFNSPRSLTR